MALLTDSLIALAQTAGADVKALFSATATFAPPATVGIRAGRYYSSPWNSLSALSVSANIAYFTTVHIPQDVTVNELGFSVTTAGAAGTKARMALYSVKNKMFTAVALTSEISVDTTGNKTASINAVVKAGTYLISIVFSGACSVQSQNPGGPGGTGWWANSTHGSTNPTDQSGATSIPVAPYTYGVLPSSGFGLADLTYGTATNQLHLWYRIA